jgi:hypothetical protein
VRGCGTRFGTVRIGHPPLGGALEDFKAAIYFHCGGLNVNPPDSRMTQILDTLSLLRVAISGGG